MYNWFYILLSLQMISLRTIYSKEYDAYYVFNVFLVHILKLDALNLVYISSYNREIVYSWQW